MGWWKESWEGIGQVLGFPIKKGAEVVTGVVKGAGGDAYLKNKRKAWAGDTRIQMQEVVETAREFINDINGTLAKADRTARGFKSSARGLKKELKDKLDNFMSNLGAEQSAARGPRRRAPSKHPLAHYAVEIALVIDDLNTEIDNFKNATDDYVKTPDAGGTPTYKATMNATQNEFWDKVDDELQPKIEVAGQALDGFNDWVQTTLSGIREEIRAAHVPKPRTEGESGSTDTGAGLDALDFDF